MKLDSPPAAGRWPAVRSGHLLALGSSAAVGSAIAATTALTNFPVMTGQAVRYGLAAILLAVCFRRHLGKVTKAQLVKICVLGATGLAGFNICLILALQRIDAGIVGAVVGGVPVVLVLFGPLLAGRSPTARAAAAAATVVLGTVILQWSGSADDPVGLIFALGALAGECAFSLVAVPLVREIGAMATATYAATAGAVLCGMIAVVADWSAARVPTTEEALAILYLAVVASAGAFSMWYAALDRIPVETAGVFAGVVPVCALVTGIVLGVSPGSPLRFLGAAIVGVGVVYAARPGSQPKLRIGRARKDTGRAVSGREDKT